jgi:peptidyl-prolyl cis-trans isomerase SurA
LGLGAGSLAAAQGSAARPASGRPLPDSYDGPASAVAAIVNDKVITTLDVEQRMRLMILSSGRQVSAAMLPQIQNQAVRDLVQEQLKVSEAKKFEIAADESEIDAELRDMAAQGGLTLAQLGEQLAADGVAIADLRAQIHASLVWQRLIQARYRSRIKVSEEEIEQTLGRMREDATKEQFLVSEICIPVANPSQAEEIFRGSLQLIEQMRRGVPFSVVAQQFSACPSAAAGGDLGWLRSGELPPELNDALAQLQPGSVTNPIPSEGAFMIMALRDRRPATVAGEETFTLAYASAPASMGRNDALLALAKLKTAEACSPRALRQDLGRDIGVARLENVKMADIDERFRASVETLSRGDLSAPVDADGALHQVFVCEKDEGLGLPSRSALEDRAYSRELGRLSLQYLRDLERKSMVDIRLKPEAPQPNG